MAVNINALELEVLAYAHEKAEGYNRQFPIFGQELHAEFPDVAPTDLQKALSYLDGFQLVRMGELQFNADVPHFHLTSAGENFMRELEVRAAGEQIPNTAKIGRSRLRELWKVSRPVVEKLITAILVEMLKDKVIVTGQQ